MAEHDQLPKVYETVNPSKRFVTLAQQVLTQFGFKKPAESGKGTIYSYTWPQQGGTGVYYDLQRRDWSVSGQTRYEYTLGHYRSPGELPRRYRVRNNGPIRLIDEINRGVPLDAATTKEERQQALTILTVLATTLSINTDRILKESFENGFRDVVGGYVLSHLAVSDSPEWVDYIDDEVAAQAAQKHQLRMDGVADEALMEISGEKTSEQHRKGEEAYKNPKINGPMLNIAHLSNLAARNIGRRWQHTIPQNIDSQHNETIAKLFGN